MLLGTPGYALYPSAQVACADGYIERIPGGTRQNYGQETGLGGACGREISVDTLHHVAPRWEGKSPVVNLSTRSTGGGGGREAAIVPTACLRLMYSFAQKGLHSCKVLYDWDSADFLRPIRSVGRNTAWDHYVSAASPEPARPAAGD